MVRDRWTVVADVAYAVAICVELVGVGQTRTVVDRVRVAIAVSVWTFTRVTDVVVVGIGLVDVWDEAMVTSMSVASASTVASSPAAPVSVWVAESKDASAVSSLRSTLPLQLTTSASPRKDKSFWVFILEV